MNLVPRSFQDRGGSPTTAAPPSSAGGASSRAGYFPVPLQHVPASSFEGLAIYLRSGRSGDGFALYSAPELSFSNNDRNRLLDQSIQVVHVRVADHIAFQRQMEESLATIVADPDLALAERSAILYGTCVELVDELLNEPNLATQSPRLEQVSRAVTHLVLGEDDALSHLHRISSHDYYTATHMVNVATFMVTLACALGHEDTQLLSHICMAGLVHDIGKTEIPSEILNKTGPLSDEEWSLIRRHPETSYEQLRQDSSIDPVVLRIVREHHEREDGTGYAQGLKGDAIHPLSKVCAVVDSFDAMTAFRPFKDQTKSVAEALTILREEAGTRYDEHIVDTWIRLLGGALDDEDLVDLISDLDTDATQDRTGNRLLEQRAHPRYEFNCNGTLRIEGDENGPSESTLLVTIRNVSRSGLGLTCENPIPVGVHVSIHPDRRTNRIEAFTGRVVRCRPLPEGIFEVGVSFER